jgi:hypothetical protein
MTRRLLDWFLLAAALSGGVLALWTGIERSRLSAKYRHLTSLTGELPIADRSKVYVKSLDTGDPLHFAWRVYFPPRSSQLLVYRFGAGKYTCWPCPTYDSIARVRIRPDNRGAAQVYVQFGGISTQLDLGDKEIARAHARPLGQAQDRAAWSTRAGDHDTRSVACALASHSTG